MTSYFIGLLTAYYLHLSKVRYKGWTSSGYWLAADTKGSPVILPILLFTCFVNPQVETGVTDSSRMTCTIQWRDFY